MGDRSALAALCPCGRAERTLRVLSDASLDRRGPPSNATARTANRHARSQSGDRGEPGCGRPPARHPAARRVRVPGLGAPARGQRSRSGCAARQGRPGRSPRPAFGPSGRVPGLRRGRPVAASCRPPDRLARPARAEAALRRPRGPRAPAGIRLASHAGRAGRAGRARRARRARRVSRFTFHVSRSLPARRLTSAHHANRSRTVFSNPPSVGSYHLAPRNTSGRYSCPAARPSASCGS